MHSFKKMFVVLMLLAGLCSLPACRKNETPTEIRVGGLFDLTGPTHESCVPYAAGIRGYIDFINAQGGVNGRQVRLFDMDYAYLIPRAETAYQQLAAKEKVHVILGWGTGDTEQLRPLIARDKIPFMSASYSARLGEIDDAPYNFLIGVTYSDQMRIVLKHIADQWQNPSRRPRVAFISSDSPFGRSPLADGRSYAAAHGIEVVAEEILPFNAQEAGAQLSRIKATEADYAILHDVTWAGSVVLREARQMGLKTQLIGLNWCVDEKILALAGEAAEGYMGVAPFAFVDQELPGIKEILAYNRSKGIDIEGYIVRYIQGWVTARVMLEGVRRAGDDLSGPGIRKGLEEIKGFDTGSITAPITFSAASHVGTNKLKLVMVRDGKWQTISDFITAE